MKRNKHVLTQFDRESKEWVEVLPKNEKKAMKYVLSKAKKNTKELSNTTDLEVEKRKKPSDKLKRKGLRGSNTPKETHDYVEGLGVDAGELPSGGGYEGGDGGAGPGGGVGASILSRLNDGDKNMAILVTSKKMSFADKEWWDGLSKAQQDKYVKDHPNSKYAKHASKHAGPSNWLSDTPKEFKGKKDKESKKHIEKRIRKSMDFTDKLLRGGPSFASRIQDSVEARLAKED